MIVLAYTSVIPIEETVSKLARWITVGLDEKIYHSDNQMLAAEQLNWLDEILES